MKIEEIRASFTIYVIASEVARVDGIGETLGLAGYVVATFSELTAAFSEFYSNPPHFLVFDAMETGFNLQKAMAQVASQLPESHIFLVTPVAQREKTVPLLEHGVYDLILTPLVAPVELVRAMDRATERDYFMYLNERLAENQSGPVEPAPEPVKVALPVPSQSEDMHLQFARQLFDQVTIEDCVRVYMTFASLLLGSCPLVYFKYIPNRRVLLAGMGENLEGVELRGLGVNMNEADDGFRAVQLREPMRITSFVNMVREVFNVGEFFARPVVALGEILGVVCFLGPDPSDEQAVTIEDWLVLLGKALSLVESEKRLHVVSTRDLQTELLNRQTFIGKIGEEISRSRRTRMPVSLVTIAVDQYGQLSSLFGQEESALVLRAAARILEKHSRVNDILGRIGVDEFGLLLPHTSKKGGMIKAERLRRILETADFSKVLAKFPRLTISLGISEYPSLVRDAEELLQSADEALDQVRTKGNLTCVAQPANDFEADFVIEEKAQ